MSILLGKQGLIVSSCYPPNSRHSVQSYKESIDELHDLRFHLVFVFGLLPLLTLILSLLSGLSLAQESVIPLHIELFQAVDVDYHLFFVQSVRLPVLEGDPDPLGVDEVTILVQTYFGAVVLCGIMALFDNLNGLFTQIAGATFTFDARSVW